MTAKRFPSLRTALLVAASALALVGAVACGSGDGDAPSGPDASSSPAPAGKPAGTAQPAAPAGDAQVGKSLDDIPTDVPVFPDSTPAGAIGLGKGPKIASYTTSASPDEVLAYFEAEFPKQGWSLADDAKPGGVSATKAGRTANVRTNPTPDGTNIAIVLEGS